MIDNPSVAEALEDTNIFTTVPYIEFIRSS